MTMIGSPRPPKPKLYHALAREKHTLRISVCLGQVPVGLIEEFIDAADLSQRKESAPRFLDASRGRVSGGGWGEFRHLRSGSTTATSVVE